MKKISLIYLFLILALFGCSSSDNDNTNSNVYFNFTINNKNYSSDDYQLGDICWQAQIVNNSSKVNLLMSFKDPSDNLTYCGVVLNGINNAVGNTNGCDFALVNGDETIGDFDCSVELTEVGNFYVGTFSGNFQIVQGLTAITRNASGSFRVPKE